MIVLFFRADVMFGAMAYFTKSIIPSAVVHSIGLLIFLTLVWPYDAQRQVVWETGATTGFWINVAQAILAFSQLARLTKRVCAVGDKPRLAASDDKAVG